MNQYKHLKISEKTLQHCLDLKTSQNKYQEKNTEGFEMISTTNRNTVADTAASVNNLEFS